MRKARRYAPGTPVWVNLETVAGTTAASKFYGGLFGWTALARHRPLEDASHWWVFVLDGRDVGSLAPGPDPVWAMYMSVDNADETAQLVVDAAKDFYKPPICPRSTSVLGPTASEDRHPTGPNKQSGGDQDDAQDQLALDQLHNADHDKDGGNNPQNGCTHGAIRTLGSPALSPLLPGRLRSRGLLEWSTASAVSQVRLAAGVPACAEAATTSCAIPRTAEPGLMRALVSTGLVSLPGMAAPPASSSPPSTSCTRRVGLVVRN